jgi:hypothetical protein
MEKPKLQSRLGQSLLERTWSLYGINGLLLTRVRSCSTWQLVHPVCRYSVSGHVGSLMLVAGCDGVEAASLPWFKISEDAWNGQEWASDTLNKSAATWTFKIPEEVAPGLVSVSYIPSYR